MGAPASVCAGGIKINGKGFARWFSREGRLSHPVTHRVEFSSGIHMDANGTDKHTHIHPYNKLMFKK